MLGVLLLTFVQSWSSGDTHVHFQKCDNFDLTLAEVQAQKDAAGLDFEALQLWARWGNLPEYLSFAPLITGSEAAPGIRYGVEVSGFPASQFGHLNILCASDGDFPLDALYGAPILAYYRAQGAVVGYAHVSWPESFDPRMFFGGLGASYCLPIDAALRSIDFLESRQVAGIQPSGQASWRGMYYKLENAGLRLGLCAGTDDTCADSTGVGDPRTWAQAGTYAQWCSEIAAGRASIADAATGRVELVGLTATLVGGGDLEILANGVVVASGPSPLTASPPASSCWLAARAASGGSHTAGSYWIVADEPIAVAQDCAYWVAYCDGFVANLDAFAVPAAEAELTARITAARDIFAASFARTQPWPSWAVEFGPSTPASWGPISIGVTSDGKIDCLAAPGSAPGWLMIGVAPAALPVMGITLLVNPTKPYALVPVVSSAGGYAKALTAIPSGKSAYAQFIWPKPGGGLCASDGLAATGL